MVFPAYEYLFKVHTATEPFNAGCDFGMYGRAQGTLGMVPEVLFSSPDPNHNDLERGQ